MHILFVDDLPDTRQVFRLAFGLYGHSTELAGNGREAVEAVQNAAFDAIVMDVEMPEMNGWDAVRIIRTLPHGQSVPIIMFTAYSGGEHQRQARDAGADSLLYKPTAPQELLDEIDRLITSRARNSS